MIHKRLIPRFAFLPLTAFLMFTTGCRDDTASQQGDGTPLQVASVATDVETIVSASASSAAKVSSAWASSGSVSGSSSVLQTLRSATTPSASVALRSATTLTSGSIGVYRVSTTNYAAQSNVQYTYSSGWSATSPIYLYSNTASICAYYPYSATIEDDPTTSGTTEANGPTAIPLTSQLYSTAADLCYATSVTPYSASPSVSFSMTRAYAKMTFTITHDASYSGSCAVTGITIANAGIRSSNTLDIATGSYGSTTASGSVTVTPTDITSIASGGSTTATVLMVPTMTGTTAATLSGNMTFLFTVDGTTHAATLPVSTNNLTTLAAGSNYQIAVNISGSGFSVALGSTAGSGSSIMGATANCYMVAPSASITIPVNIKGNGGDVAGTGLSTTHTAASVGLLWQTASGLITVGTFNATSQTVTITAGSTSGNAVIAAYASDGTTILWSWHIWVTSYNPNTGTLYRFNTNNLLTFMDRNLGATGITANTTGVMGMLYQWGRKDPFPGADVTYYYDTNDADSYTDKYCYGYSSLPIYNASGTQLTESSQSGGTGIQSYVTTASPNLSNTILHPLWFYYSTSGHSNIGYDWYTATDTRASQNDALWGGASTLTPTSKTIFDPCPAGWRVPTWKGDAAPTYSVYSPWGSFGTATTLINGYVTVAASGGTWANYGITWTSAGYYPAAGYRNAGSGALYGVGSSGNYWSASSYSGYGFYLAFHSSDVYPAHNNNRAHGFSVKCVQEF